MKMKRCAWDTGMSPHIMRIADVRLDSLAVCTEVFIRRANLVG